MNQSTRRNFLQKGALASLGATAASDLALGQTQAEAELKNTDRRLSEVLRSYGRTETFKPGGFAKIRVDRKDKRLPVSLLEIRVTNQESFRTSFEKLTQLSDRVHVDRDTVTFTRGEQLFILRNRVA